MYINEALDIIYLSEDFKLSLTNVKNKFDKMRAAFEIGSIDKIKSFLGTLPKHSIQSLETYINLKSPEIINRQKQELKRFNTEDNILNRTYALITASISSTSESLRQRSELARYADTLDALLHKIRNFLIKAGSFVFTTAAIANIIKLVQPILIQYGAYILSPNIVGLAKAIASFNVYIIAAIVLIYSIAFLLDYIIKKRREKREGK